jgi:hypothetical protein
MKKEKIGNQKLWTPCSVPEYAKRNPKPTQKGFVFCKSKGRSLPILYVTCERFSFSMDRLKTRSRRKIKRVSSDPSWLPTSLVKIEEEVPQDALMEFRSHHDDLLGDFDPD